MPFYNVKTGQSTCALARVDKNCDKNRDKNRNENLRQKSRQKFSVKMATKNLRQKICDKNRDKKLTSDEFYWGKFYLKSSQPFCRMGKNLVKNLAKDLVEFVAVFLISSQMP